MVSRAWYPLPMNHSAFPPVYRCPWATGTSCRLLYCHPIAPERRVAEAARSV